MAEALVQRLGVLVPAARLHLATFHRVYALNARRAVSVAEVGQRSG